MRGNSWAVIDDPKVKTIARKAARSLADRYEGVLEEDDLLQDALILIATTPALSERAESGDHGYLFNEVRSDLMNKYVTPKLRSGEMEARRYKNVSIEGSDQDPTPTPQMFDEGTGDYTEDAITLLLPAVWDESYAYGLPDRADDPEDDMPRAVANKARGNNHWAYIADIKAGWEKTPLTLKERRALLTYYGLGWTHEDIAAHEECDRTTVTHRIKNGITKITARLNGARELYEEEI